MTVSATRGAWPGAEGVQDTEEEPRTGATFQDEGTCQDVPFDPLLYPFTGRNDGAYGNLWESRSPPPPPRLNTASIFDVV